MATTGLKRDKKRLIRSLSGQRDVMIKKGQPRFKLDVWSPYTSSTLSRSEAAGARECSRFTRVVSSRLTLPHARSTQSRYFGRESKEHETRGETYQLYSRLSSRVLS
jgi:hypothetical protein